MKQQHSGSFPTHVGVNRELLAVAMVQDSFPTHVGVNRQQPI